MNKILIGVWNYHESLNVDSRFLKSNPGYYLGEDSMKAFYNVYLELTKKNFEVKILDQIKDFNEIKLLIFINYPNDKNKFVKKALKLNVPKFLMMYEGPTIYPEMWKKNKHNIFKKIFTWNDEFIDQKKYFKINLPSYDLPIKINKNLKLKSKFCIIMGSNKSSKNKQDLYSKRLEAIQWFEKNHPDKLDFYGYGWNNYVFKGHRVIRALNRIKPLTRFLAKKFITYKGEYNDYKIPLFEKYRFSICFENAVDIPGWLTEKIFHSFFAGCVPVYLGANNITEHIPKNCFIDFRDFNNFDEMYIKLSNISDGKFEEYINNIQKFIDSEKFYVFTHEYFTKTVLKQILIEFK